MSEELWPSRGPKRWQSALDRYETVVAGQKVAALAELDRWYRETLPKNIAARKQPHVTLEELTKLTQWKMARGVWRARNLALVKGNDPTLVVTTSKAALAKIPHPTEPITELAELAGVGPATASAVAAATAPEVYPFFDELVAAQVPTLGKVTFTLGYYARYAEALREKAASLGEGWTAVMIERALWAESGGKAGV
ncbi:MAG TPA: hypothetical protein VHM30_16480 [Gemmatimonadaceae bacterium]|nr:hypothetical protein [Gemmatimonadaceae bacterium]